MCKQPCHIFLTGGVQTGKSTVLEQVLERLDRTVGGFRTGSDVGAHLLEQERWICLWDAAGDPIYDRTHRVAHIAPQARQGFPARFDALGCDALRRARENHAQLIVMDECGFLEKDAAAFQSEVLRTLDGDTPVLGIVRLRSRGWTDAIRNHPKVTLITVTEENRDTLAEQVLNLIQTQI